MNAPWRWVLPGVTVLLYFWLEAPVLSSWLTDLGADPNYSHALPMLLLLLAVAGWRTVKPRGGVEVESWPAWWLWAAGAFLLTAAGLLSANDSLLRWGAIAGAVTLLEVLASPRLRDAWRGPLLAMTTLVPWPYVIYYAITARLQTFSSWAAEAALTASGVPLARDGNLLRFQGYRLEVVQACSGLRSLLAMTALAALIAVLGRVSTRRTVWMFFLAVPLALMANLLRLLVTGYAAQLGGPESADGVFHFAEGVFTFGLGAIVLGLVAFPRRKGDRR